MINQIFLDVDGVLADWSSSAIRLFDLDPATVHDSWPLGVYELATVLGVSTNEMWRRIHARGPDFWAELDPYPWALDLYRACCAVAPTTLLTSPSLDPSAAAGKTAWIQRMFGDGFRDYLIGPDKVACARPGAVLIDDSDKNCEKFRAGRGAPGGHAVLFPQPWNSLADSHSAWSVVPEPGVLLVGHVQCGLARADG